MTRPLLENQVANFLVTNHYETDQNIALSKLQQIPTDNTCYQIKETLENLQHDYENTKQFACATAIQKAINVVEDAMGVTPKNIIKNKKLLKTLNTMYEIK